jgi:4-hydroxy-tetrahydrodipicolinate synthase
VTPYYNKPGQEGLYQHYKAVADAVDIPQILYNVPGRTACDMSDETSLRLAEMPNIIGLKDATGDLNRAAWLVKNRPEGFALYSGDDDTAMEFVLAGGDGVISVTANVVPAAMHEMIQAARNKNRQLAESLNQPLTGLHRDLFVEANPIPVKWAVQQMGLISAGIRLPLTALASENHELVREAMIKAGVL